MARGRPRNGIPLPRRLGSFVASADSLVSIGGVFDRVTGLVDGVLHAFAGLFNGFLEMVAGVFLLTGGRAAERTQG